MGYLRMLVDPCTKILAYLYDSCDCRMFAKVAVSLALLAAVLAIGTPLFSGFLKDTWPSSALVPYPTSFRSLAPGVLRQGYIWESRPGRIVVVHVFLVKVDQDYILVDVGAPGEEYEAILSAGLLEAVKDGKLRLVMRTGDLLSLL